MKYLYITASLLFLCIESRSQNVGIGTTSPQATLDIKGSQRIGGLSSFVTYDSATGRIEWKNSNLYVPVTQALMKHSAAADGLFYNNTAPVSGQLEYRNAAGDPVFYTNFTNGNGYFKNFLGVGTASPFTNFHIETDNSNPVFINGGSSLYLSWAEGGSYRGYLGSYAGNPEDVDFGTYGSSTGKIHFTTFNVPRMTINSPGNVGIGTTDPTNPLSFPAILSKKISLYPGGTGDAGFGVSGNLLKIYSDHSNADIAFGYDDYTNGFIERMRVRGNGNVGIGTTPVSEKLEVAGNAKANNFIYSTPKTLHYNLSGADFKSENSRDTVFVNLGYGSTGITSVLPFKRLIAPVHLPHGANMVKMTAYILDGSGENMQIVFYRKTMLSNVFPDNIGVITSSGAAGGTVSYQTPINAFSTLVDNTVYTYYLSVGVQGSGFWGGMELVSIVIEYTLTSAQ
jgi:hypothetical protein